MTSRKNNWLIGIVIGIILLLIYWYYHKSLVNSDKDNEQSEDFLRNQRISNLNKEKDILNGHLKKNLDLQEKINHQSQKLWRKFIRLLIILFILLNVLYLLVFKALSLENILSIYSISIVFLNTIYLFVFYKLFSIKDFIFKHMKEFSYKLVAGNRDAEFYETKNETIQDRIEQINLEIKQLVNK